MYSIWPPVAQHHLIFRDESPCYVNFVENRLAEARDEGNLQGSLKQEHAGRQ